MDTTRKCVDCECVKPIDEFPLVNSKWRRRRCIECHREHRRDYHDRNHDQIRQKARDYYRDNTDQVKASVSKASKKYRHKLKHDAMNAYGGKCACCGETELAFLTIDHIYADGNEHRRRLKESGEISSTGASFYRWLRDSSYPDGFQTMCFNCNVGRHINGGVCPHQEGGDR